MEQHLTLWCKVLGRLVEVSLTEGHPVHPQAPGVPAGWMARDCLSRDVECFGRGCPFTSDGGESPFGEIGEPPDREREIGDPSAETGFESERG